MSAETLWILLPPCGAFCWAAGGSGWPPFEKGWRRYVYPLLLGLGCYGYGIPWQASALTAIFCSAAFHLGYGEGTPWWQRFLVGCSYAAALWPLAGAGGTWETWGVLTGLSGALFVGQMWFSSVWNRWTWKLVESMTGFTHGAMVVWLLTA